jgi:hypothetical protein
MGCSLLAHLQFNRECITPICSTLQQLNVDDDSISEEELAFILRHFPKLQKFSSAYHHGEAVRVLYQQQQQNSNLEATAYQQSSEEMGLIEWTLNAPFHGIFISFNLLELLIN